MADAGRGQRPDAVAWTSVRRSTLTARVREEILAVLADRRLEPGDRLPPERELAVMLGVSRPSLREAIKSLEAEGRLDVRHGQGVYVTAPATRRALDRSLRHHQLDVDEIFAMREVLEVPAARWAAQSQDEIALARVQQAHDLLLRASRRDPVDHAELQVLDAAFHQSIVQAAGNRFLEQTQGVLGEILVRGMASTLSAPGRLEASRSDHRAILDAILAGDAPRAAEAARRHVRGARRAALHMFTADGSPRPAPPDPVDPAGPAEHGGHAARATD